MKKELKEGTKEEKKTGKIPELYLDIQRRRTADERRVLAEAELCLLTHIEYQKAVSEWNRYVTEVTPWAALFQKLAGPGKGRNRQPGTPDRFSRPKKD